MFNYHSTHIPTHMVNRIMREIRNEKGEVIQTQEENDLTGLKRSVPAETAKEQTREVTEVRKEEGTTGKKVEENVQQPNPFNENKSNATVGGSALRSQKSS